jgi:hypothetical protein
MAVPRYRLTERTFIKAAGTQEAWLHEAGETIAYSGRPSRNFIPLNTEAEAAMAFAPLALMSQNVLPRRGDPAP